MTDEQLAGGTRSLASCSHTSMKGAEEMGNETAAQRLLRTIAQGTLFTEDIDRAAEIVLYGHRCEEKDRGTWLGLSGGQQQVVLIALSLSGYMVELDLFRAFARMDAPHIELCLDAMHETAGHE